MSVRLTVKQSSESGGRSTEHLLDESSITLGRDKSCQVVLSQQAVSRAHARIAQEGNLFFLEDLGSAYGTQVNGKALPKGEKRLLRNGDIIGIAQFDVRFDKVADLPHDVESQKTSFVARNMVKDVMRGLSGGEERYLRVMNGPREGERLEVNDASEFIIGRDDSADVVFRDNLISRQHVKVRRDWSGTHVEDLGSRNGIKVNRKRTTRKMLRDGDELEVGGVRFVYICPSEAPEEQPEQEGEAGGDSTGSLSSGKGAPLKRSPTAIVKETEPEPKPEPKPATKSSADILAAVNLSPGKEPAAPEPEPEPPPAPPPPPVRPNRVVEEAAPPEKDVRRFIPVVVLGIIGVTALVVLIVLFAA